MAGAESALTGDEEETDGNNNAPKFHPQHIPSTCTTTTTIAMRAKNAPACRCGGTYLPNATLAKEKGKTNKQEQEEKEEEEEEEEVALTMLKLVVPRASPPSSNRSRVATASAAAATSASAVALNAKRHVPAAAVAAAAGLDSLMESTTNPIRTVSPHTVLEVKNSPNKREEVAEGTLGGPSKKRTGHDTVATHVVSTNKRTRMMLTATTGEKEACWDASFFLSKGQSRRMQVRFEPSVASVADRHCYSHETIMQQKHAMKNWKRERNRNSDTTDQSQGQGAGMQTPTTDDSRILRDRKISSSAQKNDTTPLPDVETCTDRSSSERRSTRLRGVRMDYKDPDDEPFEDDLTLESSSRKEKVPTEPQVPTGRPRRNIKKPLRLRDDMFETKLFDSARTRRVQNHSPDEEKDRRHIKSTSTKHPSSSGSTTDHEQRKRTNSTDMPFTSRSSAAGKRSRPDRVRAPPARYSEIYESGAIQPGAKVRSSPKRATLQDSTTTCSTPVMLAATPPPTTHATNSNSDPQIETSADDSFWRRTTRSASCQKNGTDQSHDLLGDRLINQEHRLKPEPRSNVQSGMRLRDRTATKSLRDLDDGDDEDNSFLTDEFHSEYASPSANRASNQHGKTAENQQTVSDGRMQTRKYTGKSFRLEVQPTSYSSSITTNSHRGRSRGLTHLQENKVVLSPSVLFDSYTDLAMQDLCEYVVFGPSTTSALTAIAEKLEDIEEKHPEIVRELDTNPEVEEELKELKKTLRELKGYEDQERLVRLEEAAQDHAHVGMRHRGKKSKNDPHRKHRSKMTVVEKQTEDLCSASIRFTVKPERRPNRLARVDHDSLQCRYGLKCIFGCNGESEEYLERQKEIPRTVTDELYVPACRRINVYQLEESTAATSANDGKKRKRKEPAGTSMSQNQRRSARAQVKKTKIESTVVALNELKHSLDFIEDYNNGFTPMGE